MRLFSAKLACLARVYEHVTDRCTPVTGTFGSRPLGRASFFASPFNNYYISSQHLGRFFLKVELSFFKVEGHKGLGSNSYRTLKTREPLRDRALFVALICGAERPKKFIEAIKCYESLVCTSGKYMSKERKHA